MELLSDIGFTQAGLRLRGIQRAARENGTDGIVEATGPEVRETHREVLNAAVHYGNQLSPSHASLDEYGIRRSMLFGEKSVST